MPLTVSKFLDVAGGLQANQFSIGDSYSIDSISDLDETYKQLMDKPIPVVMAVIGGDGRPNLTPMWFDYEGEGAGQLRCATEEDGLGSCYSADHLAAAQSGEHVPLDEHKSNCRTRNQ